MDDEELSCGICLDIATDAVETRCCHHIFCENCASGLKGCPLCRKQPLSVSASHIIRRMIGKLSVPCPLCNMVLQRSNLKDHTSVCPAKEYSCVAPGCEFKGLGESFLLHLAQTHARDVLQNYGQMFQHKSDSFSCGVGDPVAINNNLAGHRARLGSTGKFYCGACALNCECCDRHCGPTNGCNCASCMELDIRARRLPRGFLVNRDGGSARKGSNGFFYCGRRVLTHNRFTDGYCGPTNGENCEACKRLGRDTRPGGPYVQLL